MPLEDIEGPGKFPDDLNSAWPLGSDTPSEGDDHLRGIKNVIRNWAGTFGDGPLSDLLTAAFAPLVHTHLWADITDPPEAFPPLAHTHLAEDVTDLQDVLDAALLPYAPLEAPALTGNATLDGAPVATLTNVLDEVHKAFRNHLTQEDYTLVADDLGRTVAFNGQAANRALIIPPSAEVSFFVGARINVANFYPQNGSTVTITPGAGVNIISKDEKFILDGNGAGATLEYLGGDGWLLVGDLD